MVILHLLNILISNNREIDVFSNNTSGSVRDDVVMVKSDVKSLITSIFSQLQVNYSKFRYEDINVLPNTRYSWKGRHILYLSKSNYSTMVKLLSPQKKNMIWSNFTLETSLAKQDLKRFQNTILQLLAFRKICYIHFINKFKEYTRFFL